MIFTCATLFPLESATNQMSESSMKINKSINNMNNNHLRNSLLSATNHISSSLVKK